MRPESGPRSYGQGAAAYARHLGGIPAYVVGDDLKQAWDDMLGARVRAEEFASMFLLDDPRACIAGLAAHAICAQVAGYDERRFLFDQVESGDLDMHGQSILKRSVHDPARVAAIRDLVRISGTVIVRSFGEMRRLRQACGALQTTVARWFPARNLGGWTPNLRGGTVVIWAPDSTAEVTALPAFALAQTHGEVVAVCRGPAPAYARIPYVEPDSPEIAAVLARASCVVDLAYSDPGWAYAFAERGIPVAAASTSGADEVVDGIAVYDPWSYRSIAGAVAEALGRGPGAVREPPPGLDAIERSLALARPSPPPHEPLVSIVIPTYNRREVLRRTLHEMLRQTYHNIEIVVVNDGGEPVGDLAFDPRIRIFDRSVNVGVCAAANFGIDAANGEYIQVNSDDDPMYPDHILRLAAALERTGFKVGHANTLIRHEVVAEDGTRSTEYLTDRFITTLDATESFAFHRLGANSILVHRSVYETIGKWDEALFLADIEIQIRLAQGYDAVHVPCFTTEWWDRGKDQLSADPMNHPFDHFEALCKRHPAPGRPYVEALRARTRKRLA